MLILPAIDLLDGGLVRLEQGDFDRVTRFGRDAVATARRFCADGAPWLHVVDLDGARAGHWCNLDLIAKIAAAVDVPVQAGGGARQMDEVEAALRRGVARVVVGTAAIESPADFRVWANRFGERLAVSLDVRDRRLAIRGWTTESETDLLTVARELRSAGASRFIHTSVRRDGMLRGVDLEGLEVLKPVGLPVLVAGGVTSYPDLVALREAGAEGAIIGRALLAGTLELAEALTISGSTGTSRSRRRESAD
jgi:phosphoribosylformimino-5-aminoimidazole carboxamide ribotide isomerase